MNQSKVIKDAEYTKTIYLMVSLHRIIALDYLKVILITTA